MSEPSHSWTINGCRLQLVEGDITRQQVDAIVNAANARLAGGGGVDGAIHRSGGPSIMDETRDRYPDGCLTGEAVMTAAGKLPSRFVIHAVGPVWSGGQQNEPALLASAYRSSLDLAVAQNCGSVAFPALSAGAYGYPLRSAAQVALQTIKDYLRQHGRPTSVRFVLFGQTAYDTFSSVATEIFSD